MDYKRTEDLLKQLRKENMSYENYLQNHQDSFIQNDLSEMWKEILNESSLKRSDIINSAEIGYTYFYDIIRGDKLPSRDKVLRLLVATKTNLEKVQNVLRIYGWATLYPKIKRDSIIIYAINHGYSLYQLQELLSSNSEETLK